MSSLRYHNLLAEASHLAKNHHLAKAKQCLVEALTILDEGGAGDALRPEDDPFRSKADRAAWREARGA